MENRDYRREFSGKFQKATGLTAAYFQRNVKGRYFTESQLRAIYDVIGIELPPHGAARDKSLASIGMEEVRKYRWVQ